MKFFSFFVPKQIVFHFANAHYTRFLFSNESKHSKRIERQLEIFGSSFVAYHTTHSLTHDFYCSNLVLYHISAAYSRYTQSWRLSTWFGHVRKCYSPSFAFIAASTIHHHTIPIPFRFRIEENVFPYSFFRWFFVFVCIGPMSASRLHIFFCLHRYICCHRSLATRDAKE